MTKWESTTEHCPPLARRHAQHEEEGDDEEEDDGTAHVHRRADPGDGHCTEKRTFIDLDLNCSH